MIRRRPPRPGRAVQDFQFFAATQRATGIEPQPLALRPPAPPSNIAPDPPPAAPSPSALSPAVQAPAPAPLESPATIPLATAIVVRPVNTLAPAAAVTLERSSPKKPSRRKSRSAESEPYSRWERRAPAPDDRSGAPHHQRRCTICRHPERDAIDNDFIHWFPPGQISVDYQVSHSAIFRHAHATNLFERRNRNIRFALSHLIERACFVEPTADSIIRAVHAFCRVNDDGHWVEPPSHVVISSGSARPVAESTGRPPSRQVRARHKPREVGRK